jgi:hypothetical protein
MRQLQSTNSCRDRLTSESNHTRHKSVAGIHLNQMVAFRGVNGPRYARKKWEGWREPSDGSWDTENAR